MGDSDDSNNTNKDNNRKLKDDDGKPEVNRTNQKSILFVIRHHAFLLTLLMSVSVYHNVLISQLE
jgi:hypothetical protein